MFYKKIDANIVDAYGQSQNKKKYFNFCNISTNGILGVLRPKIYENQPAPKVEYINLPPTIVERNIYNKNTKKQIATIKPKKFGGLSYKIYNLVDKGYYAEIQTRDYGRCLVRVTNVTPITDKPKYKNGNY